MESFAQFSVYLLIFTSIGLLLFRQWRICLLLLTLQYVGAFFLISLSWSLEMAIVKLLSGWVCAAVISLTLASLTFYGYEPFGGIDPSSSVGKSNQLFLLAMAGLVLLVVFSAVPAFLSWEAGIYPQQIYGGFTLMAISALQISLTQQPTRLFIGLLSFVSAVEIIYAAVEGSVLVAALFAVIQLSIALTVSYLLIEQPLKES